MTPVEIREMTLDDYEGVAQLWHGAKRLRVSHADSRGAVARYLERNPGLSLVAVEDGGVVGTVLAGHDGRRGYMHHVVVDRACRRRGIGSAMVERALGSFRELGIDLCHIFVRETNAEGKAFWEAKRWASRPDIGVMSMELDEMGEVECLSIT